MTRETLRERLVYEPKPLRFGTSGRRGDVADLTQLEVYVVALAELEYLQSLPGGEGGIVRGDPFYVGFDLRPSSTRFDPACGGRGELAQAVVEAIRDSGMQPVNLGAIPTPAVAHFALGRGHGCMMVTGSHIPFERNGYKTYTSRGELLKSDEAPIERRTGEVRERIYAGEFDSSPFNELGMFRAGHRDLPDETADGAREYVRRYVEFLGPGALDGCRLLVYQHSAVGRDILVEILQSLGAETVTAGRSDTFVPVDTENIDEAQTAIVQALLDEASRDGCTFDAVVSTDGDSDRPLLLGVDPESNRVRFFSGDLLGMVVAEFLGADAVVVPVSCNDAIDRGPLRRHLAPKTRIGSPYVIAGMLEAMAAGRSTVCGWEANGGFLVGSEVERGGRRLTPLPTRDAVLPLLCALSAARQSGTSLCSMFARLPSRFSRASLLRRFPRAAALEIVNRLTPVSGDLRQVDFGSTPEVIDQNGQRRGPTPDELRELGRIRERLAGHFSPAEGFGELSSINWVDGVRVSFDNGDIAHVRPSGNADELRIYAVADTQERAEAIVRAGVAEPAGILRRMEREARFDRAVEACKGRSGIIELDGAVRPYDWGGYDFIPSLIGVPNPERRPFAELWLGVHPAAPAMVRVGDMRVPLDRLIREAPEALLGPGTVSRFGPQLPYLLKVLDARRMLSIQVHPNKRQAEQGYARENSRGLAPDDPTRNYRDDNHKPEVHVALTELWVLHGFRPLDEVRDVMIGVPELNALMPDFASRLVQAGSSPQRRSSLLRELYATAMTTPQERVDSLLTPLLRRLKQSPPADRRDPGYWVLRAAADSPLPGEHLDRGIFSIYLLNLTKLSPGEGTFQPAGILHAYLEGVNVELMANSDNVLRGGLTPKHVDTDELLSILRFEEGAPAILRGEPVSPTETAYRTPAAEFELSRIVIPRGAEHASGSDRGVDTLVVLEGSATLKAGGSATTLSRGRSCLIPAAVGYQMLGNAERTVVFRATVPH